MSTKWEREQKIVDRLERENRELKQKLRQLTNSIRRLSKNHKKLRDIEEPEQLKREVKKAAEKICFECNIGEYKEIIVINRRWRECQNCGKRGKTTIIK